MKRSLTIFVLLALVALVVTVVFVLRSRREDKSPTNEGLIRRTGTYTVGTGPGERLLKIWSKDNGVIYFALSDPGSGATLVSEQLGSDFHRWFLYYHNNRDLWVHSSDIGSYVYALNDAGYNRVLLNEAVREQPIPEVFKENLPSSLRRILGIDAPQASTLPSQPSK